MAAVPSIGRADRAAREVDLTRVLYERYAPQLFRYCLHQLGSREEAEDAVQSTFLNAFRGIKRGIVPERESAWLFKIAQNVCLTRRRSTWRRGRIESPADFGVVEELTPAPSRLADELVGLQDVLELMPAKQRRAILMREWQGLSYREIAAELDVSQTAVETLIFRARRSLAQGLAESREPVRARGLVGGVDLGNVVAGLKSLLLGGGAAAAKVAAVVTVVGAGTVAVATPLDHQFHHAHPPAPPAPAPLRIEPAVSTSTPARVYHAVPPPPHPIARPHPAVREPASAPSPPKKQPSAVAATPPPPVDVTPAPPPAAPPAPPAENARPAIPAAAPPPASPEAPPAASPSRWYGSDQEPADGAGHGDGAGYGAARTVGPDEGPVQTPPQQPSDAPSDGTTAAGPQTMTTPAPDATPSVADGTGSAAWNGNGHGQGDAHGRGR